jgi:hypothetical protein
MRFGIIFASPNYGWQQLVEAYPPLCQDSYLNALPALISLAKEFEDKGFEQCVVAEIAKTVRESLGPIAKAEPSRGLSRARTITSCTGTPSLGSAQVQI